MAKKLYGFMTLMMMLAIGSGIWLWYWQYSFLLSMGWMHVKILFVVFLLVYHLWTKQRMKEMQSGTIKEYRINYRWLNELPLLFTLLILIMVVIKPF
jgi:putative membrane protein